MPDLRRRIEFGAGFVVASFETGKAPDVCAPNKRSESGNIVA